MNGTYQVDDNSVEMNVVRPLTDRVHVLVWLKFDSDGNRCSDIYPSIHNNVNYVQKLHQHTFHSQHICFFVDQEECVG